jgi:uncharacterized delta-60 repeat protein
MSVYATAMRAIRSSALAALLVTATACSRTAPPSEPVQLTVAPATPEPTPPPDASRSASLLGEPDAEFGEAGATSIERAAGEQRFSAIVLTRDGSIAATGYAPFDGLHDICAARLTPAGRLDETFGDRGFVRVGSRRGFGTAIAVDGAGRLLVAGYFHRSGGTDTLLARLDARGRLDPGFGDGGIVIGDFSKSDKPRAVLVQPDGSFVLVGYRNARGNFAVRYRADGRLDTRFGEQGHAAFGAAEDSAGAFVTRAVLAPDGGIVAGGYHAHRHLGLVARLSADGKPIARFGGTGTVMIDRPRVSSAWAVAADAQGRVLLGLQTKDRRAAIVRLLSDGTHDPSFGRAGFAIAEPAVDDQFYALLFDAGENVVGVGFRGLADDAVTLLARFSPRGAVDRSFGDRGIVTRKLGRSGSFQFAAAWDAAGRLLTAGDVWTGDRSRALVMRYR